MCTCNYRTKLDPPQHTSTIASYSLSNHTQSTRLRGTQPFHAQAARTLQLQLLCTRKLEVLVCGTAVPPRHVCQYKVLSRSMRSYKKRPSPHLATLPLSCPCEYHIPTAPEITVLSAPVRAQSTLLPLSFSHTSSCRSKLAHPIYFTRVSARSAFHTTSNNPKCPIPQTVNSSYLGGRSQPNLRQLAVINATLQSIGPSLET